MVRTCLSQDIQRAVSEWFGGRITVTELALQVLSDAPNHEGGWIDDAEILTRLQTVQPALVDQFLRSGIPADQLNEALADVNRRVTPSDGSDLNLETTLSSYLAKRNKQFAEVKRRRTLGTLDLLFGCMRSRVEAEVGAVLCHHLLDAAGIESTYWTPRNRAHIENIIHRIQILQQLDEDIENQHFVLFWDGHHYRFRPSATFGGYQFGEQPLKDGSLWIARGNVLQRAERFSEEALDDLERLINKKRSEAEFQIFFKRNPEFLLALGGGKYVELHSQLVIDRAEGSLIPDFFLEKLNDKFADICDLKLAKQLLTVNRRNRPGFRAAVHEAVAQLEFYRNWFEERANRDAFFQKTGLQVYRPRIIVIIGRREDFYSEVDRVQREGLLPGHVELVTYDDVLSRAQIYARLATR